MSDRAVLVSGVSIIAAALLYSFTQKTAVKEVAEMSPAKATDGKELDGDNYPAEIKDELHSRVKTFFSEEGFQKLQNSFIVVRTLHD
jgi:hypothetical protein